jgi:hypothetical protein
MEVKNGLNEISLSEIFRKWKDRRNKVAGTEVRKRRSGIKKCVE